MLGGTAWALDMEPGADALRGIEAQALARSSVLHAEDLRADLAVLQRAYETLHPGLYRYQTSNQVRRLFAQADSFFAQDRTLGEAFLTLTRLTAAVRCGHSYPNFFNQPKPIAEALFAGKDKLPFQFRWLAKRMVVTAESGGTGLLRGTEILAIDGVETGKILSTLLPLARADGRNDAKRVAYLEVNGNERYHAFDVLYPLVFPPKGDAFSLQVRRPGHREREEVKVAAIDLVQRRRSGGEAKEPTADEPRWTRQEEGGVCVIRMPTWALYDSKWDYRAWTEELFQDLVQRHVPDLVLDLRENEGGLDAGNSFLAHLIDQPLRLPRYLRYVRYQRVPDDLNPVLDTWDRSFRDWGQAAAGPLRNGFYRLTKWDDAGGDDLIQPLTPLYRGRVWVLVGAVNSSATFQFALAVKENRLGRLVGQPTGGNRRGINGGAFFFVRLPRTQIEVDLPLVARFPERPQPDAGVVPDILVSPSAAAVAEGRDVELDRVRLLIRRKHL